MSAIEEIKAHNRIAEALAAEAYKSLLKNMTAAHQSAADQLADAVIELSALRADVRDLIDVIGQSLRRLCCDESDGSVHSGVGLESAACKLMMRALERHGKFKIDDDDDELPATGRFL